MDAGEKYWDVRFEREVDRQLDKKSFGDFPGSPVVRTPSFHCGGSKGGTGSIPGRGIKILHAVRTVWPKKKKSFHDRDGFELI